MTDSPLTRPVLSDQLRYAKRPITQADLDALDVEVGTTRIEPEPLFDSIMVSAIVFFFCAMAALFGGV